MCSDVPRCFQCLVKITLPVQGLLTLLFKLGSVTLYPLQHVQLWSPMVLLQTEFGPQTDGVSRHSFTSKTMSSTMLYCEKRSGKILKDRHLKHLCFHLPVH